MTGRRWTQPSDEPPPTSAARGGGSGTAELGVAEALGAGEVAVAAAEGPPDVDGVAEVRPFGAMEKNIVEGVY